MISVALVLATCLGAEEEEGEEEEEGTVEGEEEHRTVQLTTGNIEQAIHTLIDTMLVPHDVLYTCRWVSLYSQSTHVLPSSPQPATF